MDHSLIDFSLEGSGALTRSLRDASTSGFIQDDAPHWSIEPFIPLSTDWLADYLSGRDELSPDRSVAFAELVARIDRILHDQAGSYHTRFSSFYAPLDPDSDSRRPSSDGGKPPSSAETPHSTQSGDQQALRSRSAAAAMSDDVLTLCEGLLGLAGYRRLSREDIEACVGVASQWGVPLHVDLELFDQLIVYARGDILGTRIRRRMRNLYRRESVSVPIYQRMVVLFRLRDDDDSEENLTASALHLRMFKNVPKQDIDTLLPGSRVRISGIDHAKIIVPSLGGFLMSLRKIAQYALLFAVIALHWTAILFVLLVGYLIKSVMSYFQTKNRYQLNLTRNLYFQKLDTNAGVGYHIIAQAHRQSSLEMMLAYYAILASDQPISTRRLRRRCERYVREAIDVEVDFQVERALGQLAEMNAIRQEGDHWTTVVDT